MTVVLHELGHAQRVQRVAGPEDRHTDKNVASTYDRWVTYDGANFFFNGPAAKKMWGGPVPLARTNNNYHHVCDQPQGPQAKLKDDLMNGVTFANGRRYQIGPMDLAILADCGVPLKVQKGSGGAVIRRGEVHFASERKLCRMPLRASGASKKGMWPQSGSSRYRAPGMESAKGRTAAGGA